MANNFGSDVPQEMTPNDEAVHTLTEQLDELLEQLSAEEQLSALQALRDIVTDRLDETISALVYGEEPANEKESA